jgi:hypothetical protein
VAVAQDRGLSQAEAIRAVATAHRVGLRTVQRAVRLFRSRVSR